MLVATYDEELGLIKSVCSGFATQQEVDEYIAQLSTLAEHSRGHNRPFLHLVDATQVAIQSTSVSEQLSARSLALSHAHDRTAVITTSALTKLQTTRMIPRGEIQFFTDADEAIAWLLDEAEET